MKNSFFFLALVLGTTAFAQTDTTHRKGGEWTKWDAAISLQTEAHHSTRKDALRNTANTYVVGTVQNKYVEIGGRYEHLTQPLPGHEAERGHGLAHLYAKVRRSGWGEITLGDFYEQLGSGIAFRAYEDRALGIDNAVRGGRIVIMPFRGLTLKGLAGQQRLHFDRNGKIFQSQRGYVGATDAEYRFEMSGQQFSLGATMVGWHEEQTPIKRFENGVLKRFRQPENHGIWAARLGYTGGKADVYFEHATKTANPNAANFYTLRSGQVQMLTFSYADRGWGVMLGARRSDNFDNHSLRTETGNDLRINHLPPFAPEQSYTLAALHPYATQPQSEWAWQAEGRYLLKRGTALGGRYGTRLKVSAAYVNALDRATTSQEAYTHGRRPSYFGHGEKLFHDFTFEVSKKISASYSFTALYSHQDYNQRAIEGHADNGNHVKSHIFVYDGKHRLNKKITLRTELQYLHSKQADGNWLYGMAELSVAPYLVFSVSDQWNSSRSNRHYPMLSVAGTYKAHRLQLGVGKTREGINCSGGVCRLMPATEGAYLSYTLNF